MKKRTRIIAIVMTAVVVLGVIGTVIGVTYVPRDRTIKVLNWEVYMPKSVIKDFQKQMKKETGKSFRVKYDTADSNESMYHKIAVGKQDYDLVNVSEYMFERMYAENLLLEIPFSKYKNGEGAMLYTKHEGMDKKITDIVADIFDSQDKKDQAKPEAERIGLDSKNKIFAAPYMYGTNGIMFNPKKLSGGVENLEKFREDAQKWGMLWNRSAHEIDYKGRISMKDVARDSYTAALLYEIEIAAGLHLPRTSPFSYGLEAISTEYQAQFKDTAESRLRLQKLDSLLSTTNGYEVDEGNEKMASKNLNEYPAVGLYWSCDAGYAWNELGNKDIEFYVPQIGSNMWIDAWVMPKYRKESSEAHVVKFLDFLNTTKTAKTNMEYAGGCTPMQEARAELYTKYNEMGFDTGFFKGKDQAWKTMYLETMFPGENNNVLERCSVFRYLGSAADAAIGTMFEGVKAL